MRCLSTIRNSFGLLLLVMLLAACEVAVPQLEPSPVPAAPTAGQPTETPAQADQPAPVMLARALRYRAIGDYDMAAHDFHALINSYPGAAEVRPARFYLAESFALRGRWTSAAEALRAFLADGTHDDLTARALFWLARCNEEAGAWPEATRLYEQYRALGTPLEPYARVREAALQQAQGQNEQALASYMAVAGSDIARGEKAGSHEKAIALLHQLGRNDEALKLYADLLTLAETEDYRTRILSEAATFARQMGQSDQARTWERELVEQFPASARALDAVNQLQNDANGQLAPASAARVYEAHERYADAITQFDAALASTTVTNTLDLRRHRALALREQGNFEAALSELAAVGAAEPNGETGRQAQLDWVQTRGQNGETQAAIESYRQFAQSYPDDSRAPEALSRAAVLLERLGDIEGATTARLDLGRRYPQAEQGQDALDLAGWHLYHSGRPADAEQTWDLLAHNAEGAVAARAAFWAARAAREAGNEAASQPLLQLAKQAAPNAYYGQRAAEMLGTAAEGTVPLTSTITTDQWHAADEWLAGWSKTAKSEGQIQQIKTPIARASELAEVGLFDDATAEWNEARDRAANAPGALYVIARQAYEHDVPYIGIKAAEDLLALAPHHALPPPEAIRRLQFPTPYPELVAEQARAFDLDPRALYALLRQESMFNPHATSWVGARGLAQVMPETAAGIAANLHIPDFHPDDLYRPMVSVRFGAFYISRQVEMMDGSLPGALAAYNGGPGNATRWANGTSIRDPDAFVETIDYTETEYYVKLVYSYYGMYRSLYREA